MQQVPEQDIAILVDDERRQLAAVLDQLDETQWDGPSLCAGWSVRHVVSHVLMPYEMSVPTFLIRMVRNRFAFDQVADEWVRRDRRSNRELLEALRRTTDLKFNVPAAPVAAPLSHLVIHSEDIYRPLEVSRASSARSADLTLDQLTSPRARGSLRPGLLDGVSLVATDTGWTYGTGPQAVGTSSALVITVAGRTAALDELSGEGGQLIRARLATP